MQAVILAGGLGSRLTPLTRAMPKPMVEVLGRPFLEYQLAYARSQGVTDMVLCLGYLHEKIEAHFGDGSAFGLNLLYSVEQKPLGTALALRLAAPLLEDVFILLNGDSYLKAPYLQLLDRLNRSGAIGVITVYPTNLNGHFKNNVREEGGLVTAYNREDSSGLNCVMSGACAFKKNVVDLIEQTDSHLEQDVFPRLIKLSKLQAYNCSEWFYDIGTPQTLEYFRNSAKGLLAAK